MIRIGDPFPPAPGRVADIYDEFSSAELRTDLWVDHYLPHWTTPDRSRARYSLTAAGLELRIDADQLDWRPEDSPLRVSNLQTGLFSGEVGSSVGTHRHRPDGLVVRTETPELNLWAPTNGRLEVEVSASVDEGCMLAAWLVGSETRGRTEGGEICIFEIDAATVGASSRARSGIKAHSDPALETEMTEVELPVDAERRHRWEVEWCDAGVLIGCEGTVVFTSAQVLDYPMFLMLDLFETSERSVPQEYPKTAAIHSVRGWAFGDTGDQWRWTLSA